MMLHESLETYYRLNFQLMQHHKYSITDIEQMIPWEREVYLGLLRSYLEEEQNKETNNANFDIQ